SSVATGSWLLLLGTPVPLRTAQENADETFGRLIGSCGVGTGRRLRVPAPRARWSRSAVGARSVDCCLEPILSENRGLGVLTGPSERPGKGLRTTFPPLRHPQDATGGPQRATRPLSGPDRRPQP